MIDVLRRHRITFFVLAMMLLLLLLWLLVSRQDTGKVPLRGVFVIETALKGVA